MATKADLEAEVALLRGQNEALKSQAAQSGAQDSSKPATQDTHIPTQISDALKDHGIDPTDIENLGTHLADELTKLNKDHPILTLLGVFAIGCIVGRAFR